MGDARDVAASTIIDQIEYELRDADNTNYSTTELLAYINRCNEWIYEILVDENSEMVGTSTGTITTVAGTQNYTLADNSMGDFWLPVRLKNGRHAVWISEYEPMQMCSEDDLYDAINANEGSTTSRAQPERFCLRGGDIWFEEVPDDAYTVNLRYYPNFTPLADTSANMPYYNLFNNDIIEGVKVLAKNRNERGANVDAMLKNMFQERALRLMRMRRKNEVSIKPRIRQR
jgi:hypothetical protein